MSEGQQLHPWLAPLSPTARYAPVSHYNLVEIRPDITLFYAILK